MLVVGLCASILIGLAAQTSSEIRGTVSDQQGLPIAGATVEVRSDPTGAAATLLTGPDGGYREVGLPPGLYTVTASHEGFATSVSDPFRLSLNSQLTLDFTLAVSGGQERVTVDAESTLIDTTSPSTGSTITPR